MGSILSLDCMKTRNSNNTQNNNLDEFEAAIFKAKIARDKVKDYLKRMGEHQQKQKQLAKEQLKNQNRTKAKLHLSRAKAYETQVESGQGQLNILETQIMQIDQIQNEKGAIEALQQGNTLLKKLQNEISVDKWEQISDDLNECREQQNEIQDFFKNYGIDNNDVDIAIENEIEELLKSSDSSKNKKSTNKESDKLVENGNKSIEFPDVSNKEKIQVEDEVDYKQNMSNGNEAMLA